MNHENANQGNENRNNSNNEIPESGITPKKHYKTLMDLNAEFVEELMLAVKYGSIFEDEDEEITFDHIKNAHEINNCLTFAVKAYKKNRSEDFRN